MKRVLLIPSDHGGGRGHVTRCLYLAKLLRSFGKEAGLVLEPKHYRIGIGSDYKTFLLDTRNERFVKYQFKKPMKPGIHLLNKINKKPLFIEFDSLAYQVPRDGYWTTKLVNYRFKLLSKIIEEFKPDTLIGDTHFLTYLCAIKFNIPVVQVSRLAGYPPNPDFLWWKNNPQTFNRPQALEPFMPLINDLKLSNINKAEDLLIGDKYIIPAIKEIEPINNAGKNVIYCGPLTEIDSHNQRIPFFEQESTLPKIYVSIGGGADRSQEKVFFERILSTFNKQEFNVLVSTGNRLKAEKINDRSVNVHFVNWVHGPSAIKQSDLVIYHGGYGTTMEVLNFGRPSIIIPSHSEQEGNGRRLEELNIGKVLHLCSDRVSLDFSWPFGEYAINAGFNFELVEKNILDSVHKLLYDSNLDINNDIAQKLKKSQQTFDIKSALSL